VTDTESTVPGIGERTVLSACPALPVRDGPVRCCVSAQACPSRPSHTVRPSLAQEYRQMRPS